MVAGEAGSLEIFQLESCRVLLPNVLALAQTQHVLGKIDQLLVGWVVKVRDDGNAIVQLESERKDRVVDQDQIFQSPIPDDS